jgi:CBS domain containing-hemolysin-like protein
MIIFSVVIVLFFSAFFSGIETGYYSFDKVRLYYLVEKKDLRANSLKNIMNDSQTFIFTILICNNIAVYLGSLYMTKYYGSVMGEDAVMIFGIIPWSAETAATLTLLLPFFFFGEALPKSFFAAHSDLLYRFTWLLQGVVWLFKPLTLPLKVLSRFLTKSDTDFGSELQNLSLNKLCSFMNEGNKTGALSTAQNNMIENLIHLKKIDLSAILIPIEKIESLPITANKDDLWSFVKRHKINTIPIYDSIPSSIVGVVNFFDVMDIIENGESLKSIISSVEEISISNNLESTFKMMQYYGMDYLKVTKNGNICGVVKLKDIIKKITS